MVVKHSKLLGKETRRTGGRKGPAFAQSGARQAFHKRIARRDPCWGQLMLLLQLLGKSNRFVDVHGLFFYPLMRGYDR